jgi:hypothetical protein
MPANNFLTVTAFTGSAITGNTLGTPVYANSEKVGPGQPCVLEMDRTLTLTSGSGSLNGTVTIYGTDLPNKDYAKSGSTFQTRAAAVTGATPLTIATDIDYAAFSNNNYIVDANGSLLTYKASGAVTSGGMFTIFSGNGTVGALGKTVVMIGTTGSVLAVDTPVAIFKATPSQVLAASSAMQVVTEIVGKTVFWSSLDGVAAGTSPADVRVMPR